MGSNQIGVVLNLAREILKSDLRFIERFENVSLWLAIYRNDISRSLVLIWVSCKIEYRYRRYNLALYSNEDVSVLMMDLADGVSMSAVSNCCEQKRRRR